MNITVSVDPPRHSKILRDLNIKTKISWYGLYGSASECHFGVVLLQIPVNTTRELADWSDRVRFRVFNNVHLVCEPPVQTVFTVPGVSNSIGHIMFASPCAAPTCRYSAKLCPDTAGISNSFQARRIISQVQHSLTSANCKTADAHAKPYHVCIGTGQACCRVCMLWPTTIYTGTAPTSYRCCSAGCQGLLCALHWLYKPLAKELLQTMT